METMNVRKMSERLTGTKNEHYNLISVVYHQLQSASRYEGYIEDARNAGDEELVQFLNEVKDQACHNAERAKQLLKQRDF